MTLTITPSSLQQTVATILASPAPVLAVDACGILDLVRSQYRLEAPNRLLERAFGAIGVSLQTPAGLHLAVFEQVSDEVARNIGDELLNLRAHCVTLENTGSVVLSAAEVATWKRSVREMECALSNLPRTWMEASHNVLHEPECMLRARTRLAAGIAPGKRGSNNEGDCVIAEHLLKMATVLRQANFNNSILFVSSNIKDFGRSTLKAPLDTQFAAVGIEYLPNVEAAMVQLGY